MSDDGNFREFEKFWTSEKGLWVLCGGTKEYPGIVRPEDYSIIRRTDLTACLIGDSDLNLRVIKRMIAEGVEITDIATLAAERRSTDSR